MHGVRTDFLVGELASECRFVREKRSAYCSGLFVLDSVVVEYAFECVRGSNVPIGHRIRLNLACEFTFGGTHKSCVPFLIDGKCRLREVGAADNDAAKPSSIKDVALV